jgi:RHS repeat-associated protein
VQDALSRSATVSYDATTGQPKSVTAVSGRQTTYTWDGPRLKQVVDGPKTVNVDYESVFSQPTHIYGDVTEQWRTYDLNQATRPLKTSRVAGQGPITYSFDAYGRILTMTDTLGHVTTWYHQPMTTLGNTDSISAPGLLATRFTYDNRGRKITTRHPDGSTDSTYYDLINRVTATVDGFQHRTSYAYDSLFLRSVTDPKSQQYVFTTNALGWVEQEVSPGSAIPLIAAYDANGNVISTTNRRGGQVTHSFDALDRDTVVTADGQATHILYGANDQFVRLLNPESSDSLVMDAYGRLAQANTNRAGNTYNINYSLGNDGRLLGLSATSPHWSGARGPTFTYDSTKNVKTLTSSFFTGSATITWNRDGLPTGVQYPNGLTSSSDFTQAHDVASLLFSGLSLGSRLTRDSLGRISAQAPANFADESEYQYNPDGSLASWSLVPQQGFCTFNASYGYSCTTGIPTPAETYAYDAVGNNVSGGASYTANRLMSTNGYSMLYDADGNLISKSKSGFSQTLSWNSLGQLTSVTTNGTTVTFGYDGLGRRVRKTASGITTGYLYGGADLLMDLDGSGNPVTEYAYWPGVDAPFAMSKGGQTYYFAQDPTGNNITGLIRASDNSIQASYGYTPFGVQRSGSFDNVGNSLQFAARQYDSESQLLYFRARYYDPQVGRFISEDPVGLGGGINPYAYAGNDPINAVDPSGLCTWHMHSHDYNTGDDKEWDEEGTCAVIAFHPRRGGGGVIGSPPGISIGGTGGGGNGNPPEQPQKDVNWRECGTGIGLAALSIATDYLTLGELGEAVAAYKAGSAIWKGYILGQSSLRFLLGDAEARGIVHEVRLAGATPALRGLAGQAEGSWLGLWATGDVSGWDFIPFAASVRATVNAVKGCLPQ